MVTVEWNVTYTNLSDSCFKEESPAVALSKMTADLPVATAWNLHINVTANPRIEEDTESDIETSSKRICKPTQKVTDLLEGRVTWSENINKTVLAPRIQQPTRTGQQTQ